ncbi:FAD-binding protein [Nocardiopsis algeriensis]|uniref:FAD-dependent oxidoreductase n=1 Tax=Nocardiopsis algeriensis TaxID=1478215 RepID=UPI003B43A8EF
MAIGRRGFLRAGTVAAAASAVSAAVPSPMSAGRPAGGVAPRHWDSLRRGVQGDVVLPGDPGYTGAIQLQVAEYDKVRPAAVLYCESERDVSTGLLFAQDHDLPLVPRSGGHNNAGYSTCEGLVLDVSRMNGVSVGGAATRVGAGLQAVDALPALAPYGVALPNGTCPTVSVAGFVTGGGTGPFSRRCGVAPDNLRAARVVLADGSVVTCDDDRHPDLFWAIRGGGGGNFGIITEYTLEHVPVSRMSRFRLVWPWDSAVEVALGFQEWLPDLSRDIAADLLAVLPDAAPGSPPLLQLVGTSLGESRALEASLDRLVALTGTEPSERTAADLPYQEAMMAVWGCADKTVQQCHRVGADPAGQLPRDAFSLVRGRLVDEPVGESGVTGLLEAFEADRLPGQTRVMSWRAMGGRTNEIDPAATAFQHRTAAFNVSFVFGLTRTNREQEEKDAVLSSLHNAFDTLDPHSNGHTLQNFTDPYLPGWRHAYYGRNSARLVRTRRAYDRHRFFRLGQAI